MRCMAMWERRRRTLHRPQKLFTTHVAGWSTVKLAEAQDKRQARRLSQEINRCQLSKHRRKWSIDSKGIARQTWHVWRDI